MSSGLRIAIVAAEPSGDLLGAGLMRAIKARHPNVSFEGVGGSQMLHEGIESFEPLENLSVMGLVEVLKHLPRLLKLRKRLVQRWLSNPPDLFIGVDAPDFNLGLETALKEKGIKTLHYVCPTVWAWREKRVKKIKAAVDGLLAILPFEPVFLAKYDVNATYVGHTLAQSMPLEPNQLEARSVCGLSQGAPVLAILPGSRGSEVSKLLQPFLNAAQQCQKHIEELEFVIPATNQRLQRLIEEKLIQQNLQAKVVLQDTQSVLAAADVVLCASGTATLEGLLSKRPMVIGYKLHWLTFAIIKWFKLMKIKHYALANIISGEVLAPELIQNDCTPNALANEVMRFFKDENLRQVIAQRYTDIHGEMMVDTDRLIADAVDDVLQPKVNT
jgi:lipid-A-disaccharide synthase